MLRFVSSQSYSERNTNIVMDSNESICDHSD